MDANPFFNWLQEVVAGDIIADPHDMLAEARGNQWSFALTSEQATSLRPEQVAAFVRAVADARGHSLSALSSAPMLFYCWYDDQAIQLRLSLVSAEHGGLPFSCRVERVTDLGSIAGIFLGSPYHDGIPLSDAIEPGADDEVLEGTTLRVWVIKLPVAND